MILIIDNYDSFTFNLYQQIASLAKARNISVEVYRNDKISLKEVAVLNPLALVFSPGPGGPDDTGISRELVKKYLTKLPMLGVCLGHQMLASELGAKVSRAKTPRHGKTSNIRHTSSGALQGVPCPFKAARYHSLTVEATSLPTDVRVDGFAEDGELMAFSHYKLPILGVQFHPESFLTEHGNVIINNFLNLIPSCEHIH